MKILENAKHSNYLIRKYGSYQIIPSGVLLELKLDVTVTKLGPTKLVKTIVSSSSIRIAFIMNQISVDSKDYTWIEFLPSFLVIWQFQVRLTF